MLLNLILFFICVTDSSNDTSNDTSNESEATATITGKVTLQDDQIGAYTSSLAVSTTSEYAQRQTVFCGEVRRLKLLIAWCWGRGLVFDVTLSSEAFRS